MSGQNPKGYNNPTDWEKIEQSSTKTVIIETNQNLITEEEESETVETTVIEEDEEDIIGSENFDEVLELTQYTDNMLATQSKGGLQVVAEYTDVQIDKKHEINAKNFVNRITKFILDFNDVNLTEQHKKYIKHVAQLQTSQLQDLLELTDVNKQMLNNIVARVNTTQAEDYAIIASYNNLVNQHLKLIKELQNTYKAIPGFIKKMRAEVITNQELGDGQDNLPINENVGVTQYNNQKTLLKDLAEKYKEQHKEKDEDDDE